MSARISFTFVTSDNAKIQVQEERLPISAATKYAHIDYREIITKQQKKERIQITFERNFRYLYYNCHQARLAAH